MRRAEEQVRAFQRHINAAEPRLITDEPDGSNGEIANILTLAEAHLSHVSTLLKTFYRKTADERLMRMQLMCEELGEIAKAMAHKDSIALCDGVADLTYVVVGTAVVYRLPLEELFDEVHHSNMTKDVVRHAHGVKGKGENFIPPDIAGVIQNVGWR